MPSREQLRIRTKHRMDGCRTDTSIAQRCESLSQWRFQRPNVEHDTGRLANGQFLQHLICYFDRRGHDDQISIHWSIAPISNPFTTLALTAAWIRDNDGIALRPQEFAKP